MSHTTIPIFHRTYVNKVTCALDAARVVVILTYLGIRVDRASVDCGGCGLWWPSWSITPEANHLYASTIDIAARPVSGCDVTQTLIAMTAAYVLACGCCECADMITAGGNATNRIEGWLERLGSSTGWPTADRAVAQVVLDAARAVADDDGFLCRFVAFVDGKIMYSNGRWFNWTSVFWKPDEHGVRARMQAFALHHVTRAKEAYAKAMVAAQDARTDKAARVITVAAVRALRDAEGILEQPRQDRVLKAAQTSCHVDGALLDANPMTLCVQNGIVNLETGELSEPDPSALMTKVAACAYDPAACAPRFERFLEEVQPDVEVRSYLQRWAGYCTTGSVQEQAMAIWTGAGSNGKSLLQTLLASALGSYTDSSEAKLLVGRERREEGAEPGLAKLRGLRFTYANESDEHGKLNSARIKMLCSTDPIAPRTLHKEPITFTPSAKVVLSTNHLPVVDDMSNGMWRRLQAVPFTQTFVDADSAAGRAPGALVKDMTLESKLKVETPGVLTWMVQGALLWSVLGLEPPPAVRKATAAYQADNDAAGDWLSERTIEGGFTSNDALYVDYVAHGGLRFPPPKGAFTRMLRERGIKEARRDSIRGSALTLKPLPVEFI